MKIKEKEKEDAPSPQPEKVFYDNRIKRKNVLALNEKVAAIREYEKMPVYKRIGRMFHCSPDQIKRIVQQRDAILKAWEQRTRRCQDAKTLELKVVRVSMLGKAVYDWLRRMMYYKDFMITDGLIQKMALQFKSAMGLQNFFPHQEWCDKFRQTYKITVNDSKQLNIGYTQGFSVQIKDVMKDVLSECTPDGNAADDVDDNEDDNDDDDYDIADNDSDDDRTASGKGMHPEGNEQSSSTERRTAASIPLATTNKNLLAPKSLLKQPQQRLAQQQIAARSLPQLQPIRQLVALPFKANGVVGGLSQKVLVATPITPASGVQMPNGGSAPMTMTIIPFTTLAQAQPQSAQTATVGAAARSITAAATTAAAGTSVPERCTVPPPIIDIKKEIKKEPEEVYIKQECISDDEGQCVQDTQTPHATAAAAAAELPEGAAVKVNLAQTATRLAVLDDASLIDDDNLALASLRKLICQPATRALDGSSGSTTRTARTKQMSLKSLSPSPSSLPPTATPKTPTLAPLPPVAVTLPPPPLTRAPATSMTIVNRTTTNKRKQRNSDTPGLAPIKSCSEARRYLKLLEDFALYKENFRLIGLITRADEVLRDLDGDDGDDDIDVD